MTKNEVIENLVSEVEEESHRNRIKKFLNGETDNFLYITKKNLRFVNNFKMEDFTKNKNFFKTEAGEVLLKYFKCMYNNFPDELSYQFSNFPLKYKIFKMLNFSEEFVKKDFENKLTVYQEELKNAKEEVVKPFQQAEVLKEKKERLSELNKLLDMGNSDKIKESSWNKEKEGIAR